MGQAKDIFLLDPASKEFGAVVKQSWFEKGLAFADAEMINMRDLTPEKLQGAREYKRIIQTIAEVESNKVHVIPPILNHDFDKASPQRKTKSKVTKNETPSQS